MDTCVWMYIDMSQLPLDVSLGLLISSVRGWTWRRAVSYSCGGAAQTILAGGSDHPSKKRRKYSPSSWSSRDLIVDIPCPFVVRIAPFSSRSCSLCDSRVGLPESCSSTKTSRTPAGRKFFKANFSRISVILKEHAYIINQKNKYSK